MFTGIIETLGVVKQIEQEGSNVHLLIEAAFANALKIDQSVAHNGACLTVVDIEPETNSYQVTAVKETLEKTNINQLQIGSIVNLERAMQLGDRLDGHIVQGHVDQVGVCDDVQDQNGSWLYTFSYRPKKDNLIIEKGSITVNGISLTAFNVAKNSFSVAVIPYTYHHTNLSGLQKGDAVNLEFDLLGKYVAKLHQSRDIQE